MGFLLAYCDCRDIHGSAKIGGQRVGMVGKSATRAARGPLGPERGEDERGGADSGDPATESGGSLPPNPDEGYHAIGAQRRLVCSGDVDDVSFVNVARRFRIDAPMRLRLYALCSKRSRIASASAG